MDDKIKIMFLAFELGLNTEKAEAIGYRFRELKEWLYPLIDLRIKSLEKVK